MIAFLLGILYEFIYLAWLYYADRGRPVLSSLFSMAVGTVSFFAVSSVIHDSTKLWYLILGYGAGSYACAHLKKRLDAN